MPRVTLKHLAARLGISESAVSLGLRNSPKIPPRTRQEIRHLADEMGYRPNPLLSELASARWRVSPSSKGNVIAYIDRSRPGDWTRDLVAALSEQGSSLGYRLDPFYRLEFSSSAKLEKVLRNRGITDVVLGPIYDESLSVQLDWSKFICVQFLSGLSQLPLHNVVKDHFNAVTLAWQKAVSRGYTRIGLVLLDHATPLQDDIIRSSAAYACQHHYFAQLPRIPVLHYTWCADEATARAHTDAFREWIQANQPDVLIGFVGFHYQVFRAEFGYDPPFIALHLGDNPSHLTGIPEDARNCAREAINLLHLCRMTHQWGIPERRIDHVIEPTWYEGQTLPQKQPL